MSIIDDVRNGITYLENSIGGLQGELQQVIGGVINAVYTDLTSFLAPMEADIRNLEGSVINIANGIREGISASFGAILPGTIDVLTSLLADLRDFMGKLTASITSTETILDATVQKFVQQAPRMEGWLAHALTTPIMAGLGGFMEVMERSAPEAIDPWLDKFLSIPNMPPEFTQTITSIKNRSAQWQALAIPAIIVGVCLGIVEAATDSIHEEARQFFRMQHPNQLIGVEDTIAAGRRGFWDDGQVREELLRAGIDDNRQAALRLVTQGRLDMGTGTKLIHRGLWDIDRYLVEMADQAYQSDRATDFLAAQKPLVNDQEMLIAAQRRYVTEGDAAHLLKMYGYDDADIALRRKLVLVLPNLNDLLKFNTRRVFDASYIEASGSEAEISDAMLEAGYRAGHPYADTRLYWAAHWRIPDLNQAFEMLHRDVINTEGLHELMRLNDVHPAFRNSIEAIAYRPLSLRLIRGMYALDSIDKHDVERAFKDLGLKRELIPKAVDYIDRAAHGERASQARALTDGLRKEVLRLYVQGKVDHSAAVFTLLDLGFTDQEADYWVAEADFLNHAEQQGMLEDGLKRLYLKSFMTVEDVTSHLKAAGVPDVTIAALFERWDLEKTYQDLSAHGHQVRELSKGEVVRALEEGILDESKARTLLAHLGYPDGEVEVLIALADYAAAKSQRTQFIDSIKALYTAAVWDRTTASNALDAAGLVPTQRDGFLATWDLERERRTEHLPIATLRDMVRTKFMTEDDAAAELRFHRFTDNTIQQLIAFWQQAPLKKGTITSGAS